jgi:hypothetical protein
VSLVCRLCVLSQCIMCLWFINCVSCLNTARVPCLSNLCLVSILSLSLVYPLSVSCLNTACVSGLFILCLVSILPVSLVCPFCVLSQSVWRQYKDWTNQKHMQYWDKTVNWQTRHRQHWDKTQRMDKPYTGITETGHRMDNICFWFVQSLYCLKTARIFGLYTMSLSQ